MTRNYPPRIITLLMLIFAATNFISAAPRNLEQAKQAALQQMSKNQASKAKGNSFAKETSPKLVFAKARQTPKVEEVYYYVFSAGNDCGYTIVSGDDRFPAIVGYTESGNYETDKLPTNLVSFMQAYQDFIDNATEEQITEINNWKARSAKHEAVTPFMQEKWNQYAPYNNMCPEYATGKKSVTGCVATAIAQILHYYETPNLLNENIPAYTTNTKNINMPAINAGVAYDWANMPNEYHGNENDAQNNAVAQLMLHVGCAVQMDYGPSSGASASAETFTKYFGMDKELTRQFYRSNYNIDEWDNMLYEEMENRHPVYYDGQSTGGGHAFVIHGYNDGMYYVNWGWGGYCDGYFDITILNPYSTSGAGASSSDDGYSMDNGMIIVQPDNGKVDEVTYSAINSCLDLLFTKPDVNTEEGTISGNIYISPQNICITGEIYVSVGYKDSEGNIINICTEPYLLDSEKLPLGYYFEQNLSVNASFNYEENEIYQLCLIESKDKENWTICSGAATTSISIKVTNGTAQVITPKSKLTATASLDENSGGYAGMDNTINITVNNSGDEEYYDIVYIMASYSETMPAGYTFAQGITVPIEGSTTFNFSFNPQSAGECNFWILDKDGKEIGQNSITFQNTTAPVLSYVSIKCSNASEDKASGLYYTNDVEVNKVYDTKAEFTFEIRNDGGYYEENFWILKYIGSENKWEGETQRLKFPSNATTSFTFTVEGNVNETVGCRLQCYNNDIKITELEQPNIHYFSDGSGRSYSMSDGEICYLAGSSSGINKTTIKDDNIKNHTIYNLNGQRINAPRKGINIIDGRKVIIR